MVKLLLLVIFLTAILVRFLYFPDNVYFSFDQARDSFTALKILQGDFKLLGPPSFFSDKLYPGPLIFYVYAPIYFFFDQNPEAAAAFFRLYNGLGVFLVYLIGTILFSRFVGLLSALLFTFSYEQTQYALYLSHQPLAVATVLLFYLGLSLFIFKKEPRGLIVAALGWGLSLQAHYGYLFLGLILLIWLIYFRKRLQFLSTSHIFQAILMLFLTTFTFILVEIKYHFFSTFITQVFSSTSPKVFSGLHFPETLFIINRFLHDSLLRNYQLTPLMGVFLIGIIIYFLYQKDLRLKIIFLLIWFFGGLSLYLLSGVPSYYYSAGTSVSLLIVVSLLIQKLFSLNKLLALVLIMGIVVNNLVSIFAINPDGLNRDMAIQKGMLISSQKEALDYVYKTADGQPFAVKALTIPLNVNTTWSYLFQWYGQKKYDYVPLWIGPVAEGFEGNLEVISARSLLPTKQFLIIEPTLGIREAYQEQFFKEEGYFTTILEEKRFGEIIVQSRHPY